MASRALIMITLIDRLGPQGCHRGHQIGDGYDFDAERGQLCPMAAHVAFPYIDILRYGGQISGQRREAAVFCCPDVETINVYRVEKVLEHETERLTLKTLTVKDREAVMNMAGREEVARYMRFDAVKTPEEAVSLILQLTQGQNWAWLVSIGDQPAGVLALKETDDPSVRDVTIFLDSSFWHRGLGRELMSWAETYSRSEIHCARLQAYVAAENEACQHLLESLGYRERKRFAASVQSVLITSKELDQ